MKYLESGIIKHPHNRRTEGELGTCILVLVDLQNMMGGSTVYVGVYTCMYIYTHVQPNS